MIKTYFVDGDKGGVGKSFVTRCLADTLLNAEKHGGQQVDRLIIVDADPANADVCGPGGFVGETVGETEIVALNCPIRAEGDWMNAIDAVHELLSGQDKMNSRVIFSLPAAAGLVIKENNTVPELMESLNGFPVWVLSNDESSVQQLHDRVAAYPMRYVKGVVVRNLKHGPSLSFGAWNNSATRQDLVEADTGFDWSEIDIPVLNALVISKIGLTPFHHAAVGGSPGVRIVLECFRAAAGRTLISLEQRDGN